MFTRARYIHLFIVICIISFAFEQIAYAATCKTPTDFDMEVSPVDSWTTHSNTIGADDCYIYKVNCVIGATYTFKTGCGDGATAAFDSYIKLYNSSGVFISFNDDGCENFRSKVEWIATETVAYVKVRGYNSFAYGAYTIAYHSEGGTCKTLPDFNYAVSPGNTWSVAGPLSISSNACYIYKVTCDVGMEYVFKTGCGDGATADFDTYMELYDSGANLVTDDDDGCESTRSTITWVATEAVAYIKVKGKDAAEFGSFSMAYIATGMHITPGNTWATQGPSTIASGESYTYIVTCIPGKEYTFKTGCGDGATAAFDTYIEVYNSSNVLITSNDDGCENFRSKVFWLATETLAYVKVRGYNNFAFGAFTVAHEYNPPSGVTDYDGDGVVDANDDFPLDPDRAFLNYYPAAGYESLAFEDLWPANGDHDFNDVVLDYRFATVTDASNYVVDVTGIFAIKATGASFNNAFGFELSNADDGLKTDMAVTGYEHSESYINIDGNGLETGQDHPTIIVFDNIYNCLLHPGSGIGINTVEGTPFVPFDTITIVMTPVQKTYEANDFDLIYWNPFIIVDMERGMEVHLINKPPTTLADQSLFGTVHDDSNPAIDRYYVTENNVPWAIKVPSSFDWPKETIGISLAYLHFIEWAENQGTVQNTWYEDLPGYRDNSCIFDIP